MAFPSSPSDNDIYINGYQRYRFIAASGAWVLDERPRDSILASETLAAGAFVNIWSNSGVLNARNADNSNNRQADGFVPRGVSSGGTVAVQYHDVNDGVTSLTIGTDYYLGTGGAVTATAPTATGSLVQYLGRATSPTALRVRVGPVIELA